MEQPSKPEKLHLLNLQDLQDIKSLIEGAPIQFNQARRAVELQDKIEKSIQLLSEVSEYPSTSRSTSSNHEGRAKEKVLLKI